MNRAPQDPLVTAFTSGFESGLEKVQLLELPLQDSSAVQLTLDLAQAMRARGYHAMAAAMESTIAKEAP
jgi:hypothetical protein